MPEHPSPRCFVISITPFTDDGAIDEDAFRQHLRRMAAAGVGVYVGGGGSGEGYTLQVEETGRLLALAVDECQGTVPVRAMGVEPRTTGQMVQFVASAEAAGVDAVQVYSLDVGHGHRPSPAELERYFTEVLAATEFPCILSTHQSVGYQVPIALVASLVARFPHLRGINCSHQDLGYLAGLVDGLPGRVEVHVGGPAQALAAISLGARGYLSSEANLAPGLCAAVGDAIDANDTARMLTAFATVLRLSTLLYSHGGIRATKAVLRQLNLPGGLPRPPRLPLDGDATTAVLDAVRALGVPGWEGWR